MTTKLLCVVVCGAGPASKVDRLVDLAHEQAWQVQLIATPSGLPFLNSQALEAKTGRPIRSEYRKPGEPRSGEKADAFIVAPATYNTVSKLAAGISDTYALGVLSEAIGSGLPVVVLPFVNTALANRRPYQRSLIELRQEGVVVIVEPHNTPHAPHTGGRHLDSFPWAAALSACDQLDLPTPPDIP